jgi:predicted PurR-regulated permease PerM
MTNDQRPSPDVTHTTLSVLFLALIAVSTFWVLRPFLTAILWATIVSVAAWPLLIRLQAALGGRRGLAVTIMTAGILLVVFVPVTLALITIVKTAHTFTVDIKSFDTVALPAPPAWLSLVPIAGEKVVDEWRRFGALGPQDRLALLAPYLQTALQWFAATAGNVGVMLLQFLLTAIVSAILFAKGEAARDMILSFARRLGGQQGQDAAALAARAIRAVVLGVVGTALVQTAIGGAGLFICGIPAAGLLTAVMLFLCLAQLGPTLVLAPAVIWLYWSGSHGWGTTLLVLTIVVGVMDNVVRPVLIKRGANLPLLLIFAGVIGGLVAFGIVGLFIGPVVLAVTYTLLTTWIATDRSQSLAQ